MQRTGIQKAEGVRIIKVRVWLVHLASLGVFFVPYDPALLVLALVSFFVRTFSWEGGSHRYFAHRSYKTSRAFQLFLAVLAAASAQRGPLWWACHHRHHHRHTDTEQDMHSPAHKGFLYAHLGWFLDEKNVDTDLDKVRDLSRYPELVFINKYHYVLPYLMLVVMYCIGEYTNWLGANVSGLSVVFWGFFLSTMLSLQATFVVNTLCHGIGPRFVAYRRFETSDASTNNWLLCVLTMGASWHNNHHRYMNAARAGFYWWEIDLTFYLLKILERIGLIWDLAPVPEAILAEGRRRGRGNARESRVMSNRLAD